MRIVKVNTQAEYNVIIGTGILDDIGDHTSELFSPCTACIISDDTVNSLYGERVKNSLNKSGFSTVSFIIPHGEASKNTSSLIDLVEFLAENHLTRSDIIVALGGGVVGDLAGFAASVYLRGINFIQIPTTLLACVDSSVGGKTAVDLKAGKNLMGAFHQPSLVLCDCETLNTLPKETFSDGCAEVIKYAVINDREFFSVLQSGIRENIEEVICRCVMNKAAIVEEDEFDTGKRMLLNLGHTTGHSIEALSNFSVTHGNAVAIGMAIAMKIAVANGVCPKEDLDRLLALLEKEGLPTKTEYTAQQLAEIALCDKKRSGATISFILPYGIGKSTSEKISVDRLCDFIAKGL